MFRTLAAAAVALLAGAATAADQTFTLTGDNTKVGFVGSKPDGKHEGGFAKLAGTATVTDGNPATLKIDLTIETDSLFSDDPKLTAHLKAPDFFSVKDQPKAAFKTTKVEKSAAGYTVTGELTMLGKTKGVSFPATIAATATTLTLAADFKIDRTEWGMTYGRGKIDDQVQLKVGLSAKK